MKILHFKSHELIDLHVVTLSLSVRIGLKLNDFFQNIFIYLCKLGL